MKTEKYTISVYSENNLGLLNRIATIFLKRHINIESLTVSGSEIENVSRFIIVVEITEEQVKKIIGQIEKQVEVIKAYYHTRSNRAFFLKNVKFKISSRIAMHRSSLYLQNFLLLKNQAARRKLMLCMRIFLHTVSCSSFDQVGSQ